MTSIQLILDDDDYCILKHVHNPTLTTILQHANIAMRRTSNVSLDVINMTTTK